MRSPASSRRLPMREEDAVAQRIAMLPVTRLGEHLVRGEDRGEIRQRIDGGRGIPSDAGAEPQHVEEEDGGRLPARHHSRRIGVRSTISHTATRSPSTV